MKKLFKLLGIIALVAIIGLSMVACDNNGDNSGNGNGGGGNNLIGKWYTSEDTLNAVYDFGANGVVRVDHGFVTIPCDYTVSGSTLSIKFDSTKTGTATFNISTDGNELTISNPGGTYPDIITVGTSYKN